MVHEVGDHLELVAREEARFHGSQHEAAIGEELRAGPREATEELLAVVHVQAQELVVGGPLQDDDLQIVVVRDAATEEADFVAGLTLEVEDLLPPIFHQNE